MVNKTDSQATAAPTGPTDGTDPIEAEMLASARALDEQTEPEPGEEPEASGNEPAGDPAPGDGDPDGGNETTPGDDDPARQQAAETDGPEGKKNEEPEPGTKPEDDPEPKAKTDRKAREAARREKTWLELEKEKEQVRSLERTLKEKEEELARREKRLAEPRFDAADYEAAAERFERQGKDDLAAEARARAGELRGKRLPTLEERLKSETESRKEFITSWNRTLEALQKDHPELGDEKSPLYKEVQKLLAENPELTHTPLGLAKALDYVETKREAARAADLESELADARKEIERLNRALGIGPGEAPRRPREKSFTEMTDAERERHLMALSESADRG